MTFETRGTAKPPVKHVRMEWKRVALEVIADATPAVLKTLAHHGKSKFVRDAAFAELRRRGIRS